jgi:hypothetical protein
MTPRRQIAHDLLGEERVAARLAIRAASPPIDESTQ